MFTIIQNIVVCFAAGLVNFGRSVTKRAVLESVSSQLLIRVLFVWLAVLTRLLCVCLPTFHKMTQLLY